MKRPVIFHVFNNLSVTASEETYEDVGVRTPVKRRKSRVNSISMTALMDEITIRITLRHKFLLSITSTAAVADGDNGVKNL